MKGSTTAMDALIAELLGDVGKLHTEVQLLHEKIPGLTADLDARIARMERVATRLEALGSARKVGGWLIAAGAVGAAGGAAGSLVGLLLRQC